MKNDFSASISVIEKEIGNVFSVLVRSKILSVSHAGAQYFSEHSSGGLIKTAKEIFF